MYSGVLQGVQDPYGFSQGANQGVQNPYGVVSGAVQGAQSPDLRMQQEMANLRAVLQNSVPGTPQYEFAKQRLGTLSVMPSQPGAPSATAAQTAVPGGTTIGQSNAWLSPEEMRARTNALQSNIGDSSGGSGDSENGMGGLGGAPAGGTSSASNGGGGLNLSGVGGNAPIGSSPGSLNQSYTPVGSTIGYAAPNGGSPGGQSGVLQMQAPNSQAALDTYKSTPGYQLLNAPGAYEASPGYQYAMNEAMNQVQNNASARGMLESGAVLKQMQQTASGLAQQDYGNWWNRQNQLYGDYQNRLQGLAGGPTGSQDAMTAGANAAQANLQTGSNLGSLFGNQGTSGMGGIINTAAAQSGNMINAGQQQAQIGAANQATQLAGATLANNQNRGLF